VSWADARPAQSSAAHLPGGVGRGEVAEVAADPGVDVAEQHLAAAARLHGHADQLGVGEGRLLGHAGVVDARPQLGRVGGEAATARARLADGQERPVAVLQLKEGADEAVAPVARSTHQPVQAGQAVVAGGGGWR